MRMYTEQPLCSWMYECQIKWDFIAPVFKVFSVHNIEIAQPQAFCVFVFVCFCLFVCLFDLHSTLSDYIALTLLNHGFAGVGGWDIWGYFQHLYFLILFYIIHFFLSSAKGFTLLLSHSI